MRIGSRPLSFALVSTLALGATVLGCFEPAVQGEGPGHGYVPDPNNPAVAVGNAFLVGLRSTILF